MGKPPIRLRCLVVLAVAAAACASGSAEPTTSTTLRPDPVTTRPVEPTTSTTEPDLCAGQPFCVLYEIRAEAVWSDGRPVTVEDFIYTYREITDPVTGAPDQTGYELIEFLDAIDDSTVLVGFSSVFPPWRTLFDVLLPAHFESDRMAPGAPVTGPFILEEWVRGDRIVLKRNPTYWTDADPVSGDDLGDVEEIVFVFPESDRERVRGLERGEIDIINPRPLEWMIEELSEMESVSYVLAPGAFWEHIDFNHDDPLLSRPWVREAIALGIDRETILDETVRTVDPNARALDSSVWMRNSAYYEDNYDHVYDPAAAELLLKERFCARGDDEVYTCLGQRMSFTWATTVGDEYRERTFELVEESLAEIGIEVILDPRTPSELFSSNFFFGGPETWQMISFSWKGGADPYLANSTYYCRGGAPSGLGELNVNRYCNGRVQALIRSAELLVDTDERVAAYNEADALYLGDLALIPLFQKPALLAWSDEVVGPEPNISTVTDLWNAGTWSGKERVVVALEAEPDVLDPIRPASDAVRMVLAPLLHGAYSISPSLEYVEVLVSDSTPIVRGED